MQVKIKCDMFVQFLFNLVRLEAWDYPGKKFSRKTVGECVISRAVAGAKGGEL